jgi:beta-lactamase superfamily II metal-dependent hydrolase
MEGLRSREDRKKPACHDTSLAWPLNLLEENGGKLEAIVKLRMYPAGNGDAFLISASGSNVLIDAGYAQTFDDHIARDLLDLGSRGEQLDLVIASHIDADHISGLIRFLSLNGSSSAPRIAPIRDIWHNSLRSLSAENLTKISTSDRDILNAICRRGHPTPVRESGADFGEISARQGSSLASLIHEGGYQWNLNDGTASIAIDCTSVHSLPGGSVRVVGPTQERLDGFLKWWKKRLRQMGYSGAVGPGEVIDDAFELFCEHVPETTPPSSVSLSAGGHKLLDEVYEADPSTTNGSSITAIVELGGTRVLMLADAWAEDVVNALRVLESQGCSMMFDAVKLSHHGSLRNTSPELLELIDAPLYLVSTNGVGHGHPDFEVLAAIVDRPADFSRTILLNYATPASSLLRRHRSRSNAPFSVHENATDWITIGKS